ncbi:MAG TPA: GIY-YIG nuclease family protein [Candidatus Omnitrophota bacterium]|nr:GIY-YIG nuclease family protein [Candidatus Omnitrophota bacterium]HQL41044.1 GIY-YIG nuclease family protein [Candidatus Omnitrophota bacterium]
MKKRAIKKAKKRVNKKTQGDWKVYILETDKDQLYTGITNNLEKRLATHKKGKGALFTKFFGVKALLYAEDQPTRSAALKREHEIKTWPRAKKLELIQTHKEGE